jgi:adenylosuccinate lyase
MIPRYQPADLAALFSDVTRFDTMLEVELATADAMAELGVVPIAAAVALRVRRPQVDASFVADVEERERTTNHDTAAFVDVVQTRIGGPEAEWVHFGLTSSDVVDTALSVILTRAADILARDVTALRDAFTSRAEETIDWPVTGRTHGVHAEPTTYGIKFALFALQTERDRVRLTRARETIAVGKLSGAVGTYSNIDPAVEDLVCRHLGLVAVPATQVIARDRHAELLYVCAAIGTTIEQFALEVRHMARTEVGEAEEPFGMGQKGSSSMPHKRNPVGAERLCGLARVLRGYLMSGLEDVALWHERDISHSSVERVILPDAVTLTAYMLREAARLASTLVLKPDRARETLEVGSRGLVFSQSLLLSLVETGMPRDDAYRVVQSAARRVVDEKRTLREVIESDPSLTLGPNDLDTAFSAERLLQHRHRFLDALTWRSA